MIKKILIANRGEIALRIIKTCKKLGIETFCIGTEVEKNHPHIQQADHSKIFKEFVYTNQELIVKTAKEFKVDAIHPGYGFLSENHHFAKLVTDSKIEFIGPSHKALDILGDKAKAKEIAKKLKIPTAKSYIGKNLKAEAKKIGFPLLLKAVMGGGGRGMRKVENEKEFDTLLEEVKNESSRLYENTDICIEEFIENPRHIEIQIAADKKGNVIHLFERDCSIQRRYQKVVEFCPAYVVSDETLEKLYSYAIKICKDSKLHNLATVEFLVSKDKIYFLEVNPRIQVEHPVTEEVTGLDLIELQIQIANGKSIEKTIVKKNKHVVQTRIYAESPINNYLSTSGRIVKLSLPSNERIDHALFSGIKIDHNFDPMLAKLICTAKNKEELRKKTLKNLKEIQIQGVETNLNLLVEIFKENDIFKFSSKDLEEHRSSLKDNYVIAAIIYHLSFLAKNNSENSDTKSNNPFNMSWKNRGIKTSYKHKYYNKKNKTAENLEIEFIKYDESKKTYTIEVNKSLKTLKILDQNIQNQILDLHFEVDGKSYFANTNKKIVRLDGHEYKIYNLKEHENKKQDASLAKKVICKIPGKVIKIFVKENQEIKENDTLIAIESMKIEHQIKSNKKAKIKKILVDLNQTVSVEDILVEYK